MAKYDKEPLPSSVEAFEKYIKNHHRVSKLEKFGQNLYLIHRINQPPIKVVHSNIYVLSEADAIEYFSENNDIDAIVLAGNWNSYTYGAKGFGSRNNFGVFKFREFFGALNYEKDEFIEYILPEDREKDKK